jgi:hypothetical protein
MRSAAAACGGVIVAALVACAGTTPLHERYDQGPPDPSATPPPTALAQPTSSGPPTRMCKVAAVDGGEPLEIGARHVLVQWMGCRRAPETIVRTREQALAVANVVLRKARAGEDLGRLANEYSDEPMAGSRAGSLGCFRRGTMDKRFEAAAFALSPGGISDVVETDFGFHVIQRTE